MQLSPLDGIQSFGSPTLEDFDTSNIQDGQRIGGNARGKYRQYVRFYKKKIRVPEVVRSRINPKTGEETAMEYKVNDVEKEFVEILTPGDKNSVDDFAQDFHKRQHFLQYKAFREGRGVVLGTNLDECDFISPSIATELRVLGVQTLEMFADCTDHVCNLIPSGWELREHARAVCKVNIENKNLSQVNVMKAELETSKNVIAEMQAQLDQMKGLLLNAQGQPVVLAKNSNKGRKLDATV